MNIVNIGTDVGGKWGDSADVPTELMCCRNRYVFTEPAMIRQFWDTYEHCIRNDIAQIIGLDWWQSSGHYFPTREEVLYVSKLIKHRLVRDRIEKELADIENDNEPAKYRVWPEVHCQQAELIKEVMGDDYNVYAGSEEVTDLFRSVGGMTFKQWFGQLKGSWDGYSIHLQNCARNEAQTRNAVDFVNHLAVVNKKLITCSEANYLNPANRSTWELVNFQIEYCRKRGLKHYPVIFLRLRNHSRYEWLAWNFNGRNRSPNYQDYINKSLREKQKKKEVPMADQKDYHIPALIKEFAKEVGLEAQPNYNPYLPVLTSLFFQNDNHYHQPDQDISKADFDAFLERFLNFLIKKLGHSKALNLYYDGKGKWRPTADREAIAKSNPK